MISFNAFRLFVNVFFSKENSSKNKFFIAKKSLFSKTSYRIQKPQLSDLLVGVKFFYKSLCLIYAPYNKDEVLAQKGRFLIFDGDSKQQKNRLNYLSSVLKIDQADFRYVALDKISGFKKSYSLKVMLTFLLLLVFTVVFLFTVFSKNRSLYALFLLSIIENVILLDLLLNCDIKYVYYFFPFENDANFSVLLLNKYNITVHKVPGPNSLYHNHKYFIADRVSFCSEFQFEQYEVIKKNWIVSQIFKWPLYGFENLQPYFNSIGDQVSGDYILGFISSGIWKREELGKIPIKEADFESEKKLIELLVKYCESRKINKIYIFLHPIEKSTIDIYDNAVSYYRNKFGNISCTFSDFNKNSYESFSLVNTTIAAHSTTNLQRLFCGFKTMYALLEYENNMFKGTALENISFCTKSNLFKYIDEFIKISEKDYFNQNDLYFYTHMKYSKFIN